MSEFHKATWLHKLPSTVDETKAVAQRLADAGFDLLIPCIKQVTGIVDYQSKVANVRAEYKDWDPLMVLAEEANDLGLSVHAWCCVFPEGDDSRLLSEHPELVAASGDEVKYSETQFRWSCPNRPEVQDYEAAIYQELIDNYPVQGVHLDYIRFSNGLCFCDHCKEDYHKTTGRDLGALKFFGWNNPDAQDMDEWIEWRCAPITKFVKRIREASKKGGKELSAAVFHYYPGNLSDIGQDWEAWARTGLLDYVFPMNYSVSTAIAAKWTRNNIATLAGASGECKLWEGILRPASMSTKRFISHVSAIKETGVEGITVFEYPYLTDDDLTALRTL